MASLREEARPYLEEFRDAIGWIAVWKTGRGWNVKAIWSAEYTEANALFHWEEGWKIDADDLEELHAILDQDPNACLINGYYRNIGSLEEMTLGSLVEGLRFQYENGGNLADVLAMIDGQKERKNSWQD